MHALPMTINELSVARVQGDVSHYRDPCVDPDTSCANDFECCSHLCLEGACGKLSWC